MSDLAPELQQTAEKRLESWMEQYEERMRETDQPANERRKSYTPVSALPDGTDTSAFSESLLAKAGENWETVDEILFRAIQEQVWPDDDELWKAPPTWQRASNVPQFVRSFVSEAIDAGAVYGEYSGLPVGAGTRIRNIIEDALTQSDGWSTASIAHSIRDAYPEMPASQALHIARNEVSTVLDKAREFAVRVHTGDTDGLSAAEAMAVAGAATALGVTLGGDGSPEAVDVTWEGPQDAHTTKLCTAVKQEIEDRGGSVTLKELREILEAFAKQFEEESGGLPDRAKDYLPHFGCRHSWKRV